MVPLTSLWMPIVLSAVLVFIASAVVHMLLPYHRTDFSKIPGEEDVMEALRRFSLPPGDYIVPHPGGPEGMKSAAYTEKITRGPVMITTVLKSGKVEMGGQLAQWFVFCLVVSLFAGYVASRAVGPGAAYLSVSQFASTTAFLGYAMALWSNTIWYKRNWMSTAKSTFDGLVYGLLTGGVFGWLWP